MRISMVPVLWGLPQSRPPERRWTSEFATNTRQNLAIVNVETNDGLTGFGEPSGGDSLSL